MPFSITTPYPWGELLQEFFFSSSTISPIMATPSLKMPNVGRIFFKMAFTAFSICQQRCNPVMEPIVYRWNGPVQYFSHPLDIYLSITLSMCMCVRRKKNNVHKDSVSVCWKNMIGKWMKMLLNWINWKIEIENKFQAADTVCCLKHWILWR